MKHLDSLPEVLNCSKLQTEVQSLPEETQQLITHTKYEDIFSDVVKQKQATDTYTILLKLREQLLDPPHYVLRITPVSLTMGTVVF